MTKKRYTHIDLHYMGFNEVLELINELSVENEKLKLKVNGLKSELTIWKEDANEHIQETNKLFEELQNLKNQIKIYELFLDQNDLNIEWDLFCTLNHCVNKEDTGCQTCKYMGLVDSDLDD